MRVFIGVTPGETTSLVVVSSAHRLIESPVGVVQSEQQQIRILREISGLSPDTRRVLASRIPGASLAHCVNATAEACVIAGISHESLLPKSDVHEGESVRSMSTRAVTAEKVQQAVRREDLEGRTVSELKSILAAEHVKVHRQSNKSSVTKTDLVHALLRIRGPGASDEEFVERLLRDTGEGPSPMNTLYVKNFKPIDIADQYKSTLTSQKRKVGDANHVSTVHLILCLWVNVYSLYCEKNAAANRMGIKDFITKALKSIPFRSVREKSKTDG